MKKIIELYRKARFRRNIAFAAMLLFRAAMTALIVVGTIVLSGYMTPFMILAMLAVGAGTTAYFVLNYRFYARERDVCAAMLRAKMSTGEIAVLARELKLNMKILRIYVDGV